MPIIKSSNIIAVRYLAGDPKGDSLSNPYTLEDILTASNAATNIFTSALNNGGSGYAAGNTFTVNGGSTLAQGTVLTVSGGVVLTYSISVANDGAGYSVANGVATTATSGSGVGLTIDITGIGWGVQKIGSSSYYMPRDLTLYGADTYTLFWGSLEFGADVAGVALDIYQGTHTFGKDPITLADPNKWTTTAMTFKIRENLGAVTTNVNVRIAAYIDALNTSFVGFANYTNPTFTLSSANTCVFDNCQFIGAGRVVLSSSALVIKNSTFSGSISSNGGNYIWSLDIVKNCVFTNNTVVAAQRPLIAQMSLMDATVTYSNLVINPDITYDNTVQPRLNKTGTTNLNLIDCQLPIGNSIGYGSLTTTDSIFNINFQTTLNISSNTTDGNFKLYDKDDNLIIGDNFAAGEYSGIFTYALEQLVSPLGTTVITTTVYDYQPFKLVIEKDGYETLVVENINVTTGKPTIIRATSKTTVPLMVDDDYNYYLKANKENIGSNRNLMFPL